MKETQMSKVPPLNPQSVKIPVYCELRIHLNRKKNTGSFELWAVTVRRTAVVPGYFQLTISKFLFSIINKMYLVDTINSLLLPVSHRTQSQHLCTTLW